MELRWLLVWLVCCGLTDANQVNIDKEVSETFPSLANAQTTFKTSQRKYEQRLETKQLLTRVRVDEYVGPQGAGYTMTARLRQASCPERPTGEPCVWRYFRHEGPETYRNVGEGVWTLEPLEKTP